MYGEVVPINRAGGLIGEAVSIPNEPQWEPKIPSLLFADDVVLFAEALREQA